MEAYATAWLDPASPLVADAMTVMPYMGLGALQPAFDLAAAGGRGVIVVTRSSNPEGRALQTATTAAGPSVEDQLLADIAALNRGGLPVPGTVGVVIGATLEPVRLRPRRPRRGGARPGSRRPGRDAATVGRLFGGCATGTVLPSSSRSLLVAGPDVGALRRAALAERERMRSRLH